MSAEAAAKSDASMAEAAKSDASMAEAAKSDASMAEAAKSDASTGVSVVPEAATPAASPAATLANTLTHEHYVHLTLVVGSIVDIFKAVHKISDDVEVDLEKVTSTFEAAFLRMMKEEGLGSGSSVQFSAGSNSTPSSSVGGPTPVKMEE